MKRIIFFVLGITFFVSAHGESCDAPFLFSISDGLVGPAVIITSKADLLEVQDIIVNRGNCKIAYISEKQLPKKLKFGDDSSFVFPAPCNPIEIRVKTDKGSCEFSRNK